VRFLGERDLGARVFVVSDDPRRVRLRLGSLQFTMTIGEAVDLARGLVAAVDELKAAADG
jgi:hypothetical protein